jgi:hypothetical protein
MDRERLTELLRDPTQIAPEDLGDLRSMTERFPWFSGAHLLLAVGEHAQGDVLSNDPVRTPAAYLPSRAVLFDLTQAEAAPARPAMHVVKDIQPEPLSAPPSAAPPATPEAPPPASGASPPLVEEARPMLPEIFPEQSNATSLGSKVRSPVVEGPVHVAEEIRPLLPDGTPQSSDEFAPLPPALPTPASPAGADPLDSQIREAIMASGYDLGQFPSSPSEEPLEPLTVPPVTNAPAAPLPPPVAPEAPLAQPIQPVGRITKESRLRFTDWLTASDDTPEPLIARARIASAEAVSAPVPGPITPLASEALPDPKELIDRFIQQATPAAASVKAEFFTPQQAAKRSLQDEGLVSETLAKIYEQQGDIAKAKAAYARLAIIHPGKSVYFAALSKALEGRSNK